MRTHMIKVGLTGGIGSGKSTIAGVFQVLGVPVFMADGAGRKILAGDLDVRNAVIERFGASIYPNGTVDRKALAAVVFNDPVALKDLNNIVHPLVREAFQQWSLEQDAPYVIMEAAILAESEGYKAFDRIVVVAAPEELRIQRVMARDKVTADAVRARVRSQVSEEERSRIADHVIHNDDTRLVIPQVLAVHQELINLAAS